MARASEPAHVQSHVGDAQDFPRASQTGSGAFDIGRVPFSRFGSYLAISRDKERVLLRCVHGGASPDLFRLELLRDGKPIPFQQVATPTQLTFRPMEGDGTAEIVFAEPNLLRVRGRGVELRFAKASGEAPLFFRRGESQWVVNGTAQDIKLMVTPLTGRLKLSTELNLDLIPDTTSGSFELAVEEFTGGWHKRPYPESFDAALGRLRTEYSSWAHSMPAAPAELQDAAELAAYVNWSAVVRPEGYFQHPAMLMSKNKMTKL